MHFEFYKIAGQWTAIIQIKKDGKHYHLRTGTHKTKSEIIDKTFKLFNTI